MVIGAVMSLLLRLLWLALMRRWCGLISADRAGREGVVLNGARLHSRLPVPCVPQLVLFATTPAQTGADAATGPVTLSECGPVVAPVALPVDPQVVPWATTPAQTGADTAIGPVTLFELPSLAAVAPPAEPDPLLVPVAPPELEHVVF